MLRLSIIKQIIIIRIIVIFIHFIIIIVVVVAFENVRISIVLKRIRIIKIFIWDCFHFSRKKIILCLRCRRRLRKLRVLNHVIFLIEY